MYTIFILLVITNGLAAMESQVIIFEDVLSDVHRCSRTHLYLEECVESSIDSIRPYLARGIPVLRIPHFEPYFIESFNFISTDELNSNVTFMQTVINGLTKFIVKQVRFNPNLDQIKFVLHFPVIYIDGKHIIENKMLDAPIGEKEHIFTGIFRNIRANITMNGNYFTGSAEEIYLRIINVSVKLDIGKTNIAMRTIKQNKFLSYHKTHYVNRIWKKLGSKMLLNIEHVIANVIKTTANKIYSIFPLTTLMPVYI